MWRCTKCGEFHSEQDQICPKCGEAKATSGQKVKSNGEVSGGNFWTRAYTRQELMKQTTGLMLFVGLLHVLVGCSMLITSPQEDGLGIGIVGFIYIIVAVIPFFWVRLFFLLLWVLDLMYTNFFEQFNPFSLIFMAIGWFFVYKMFKYRNNLQKE